VSVPLQGLRGPRWADHFGFCARLRRREWAARARFSTRARPDALLPAAYRSPVSDCTITRRRRPTWPTRQRGSNVSPRRPFDLLSGTRAPFCRRRLRIASDASLCSLPGAARDRDTRARRGRTVRVGREVPEPYSRPRTGRRAPRAARRARFVRGHKTSYRVKWTVVGLTTFRTNFRGTLGD
jgi:hypothetical protein